MTERESSAGSTPDSTQGQQAPFEDTLQRVIERIKDESLLFFIAVLILVVGLVALAGNSPYLRFIVVIIALLAVAGVIVHLAQEELKYRRRSAANFALSSKEKYKAVRASTKAQRFWQPFAKDELHVVIGRFQKGFAAFEATGLVGAGDAIGLTELRAFFGALDLSDFSVSYADDLRGDDLEANLILLGGPDINAITRDLVANTQGQDPKVKSTFRFGNPAYYEISLYDSISGQVYAPSVSADPNDIDLDYGVIIKTANPYAPDKHLLLIAGSFGYGTWAGIRLLTRKKEFLESELVSSGKSFECLYKTDIALGTPQDVGPIATRRLQEGVGIS